MRKLYLLPDADGYSSTDGNEVAGIQLEGGPGRYRRDKIGAPKMVQVKWTMNPSEYQYWRAFFRTATKTGSQAFLCDLLSEDGLGPAEHVCQFVPGSISLPQQHGLTYIQQASLEVKQLAQNEAQDESIILMYETSSGESDAVANALAALVNVTLPGAIGA